MAIAISEVTLGIDAVFDRSEFDEHESLHFVYRGMTYKNAVAGWS